MEDGQIGSYSGTPDIHRDIRYLKEKQLLERIYIDGIQTILYFQSELTLRQVSISWAPSSSPSSLPLSSEPSKVYA